MRWPAFAVVILLSSGCASTPPPSKELSVLDAFVTQIESDGEDFDLRISAASACLDIVSHPLTGRSDRVEFASQALTHADRAIHLKEDRVEGHFLRAVAIGRILDSEILPDLSDIGQLEASGLRARELDPGYACAGPLQLLAMLYWKAPAWPIGPEDAGEVDIIEELFAEAIKIAEHCVEIHVAYAEFLEDEGRNISALAMAKTAEELLTHEQPDLRPHEIEDLTRRIRALLTELSPASGQ